MELPLVNKGHSHDHGHTHDHGPGHGHSHDHHHHEDPTQDYEQLLGISITAILGLASLYLYFSDRLNLILAPKFHLAVLVSGIGLLALATIRIGLILTGHKGACCSHDHHDHSHNHSHDEKGCCQHTEKGHEEAKAHACKHDHGHEQGHEHCHDHAKGGPHKGNNHLEHSHTHHHGHEHHHAHSHDHSHGSGFLPLQAMILLSPIVLLMGLPGEVFNSAQALNASEVELNTRDVGDKGEDFQVTFLQLERAAAHPETRDFYEGKTVRLTGRFVGDDDKRFTLIRYKINCCAADAVPLNSIIMVDPTYPERLPLQKLKGQWVEVTGKVQFLKKLGREEFVSSLILRPEQGKTLETVIKVVAPDSNPYVN